MPKIHRILDINSILEKKSLFLLGPRATGKSYLIRQQLPNVPVIDLLNNRFFLQLSAAPWELEQFIEGQSVVVIDEVQRIPDLLNEVHRLIETKQIRFLLTGSSARKLRHKGINLLAGRAWEARLFPFTSSEIPNFSLSRYLQYGGLPPVYLSDDPEEELYAYTETYLNMEIQAEALVRKIPAFTRFLRTAALTSGQLLNFSSVANDAGVPVSTVREYYQILEDTLIGFLLPAWSKSIKRKAIHAAKFYFFDVGIKNVLGNIKSLDPGSDQYGYAFEHFIAQELRAYLSYRRIREPLSYWQAKNGQEVDFIIGDDIAIEVKTAARLSTKHLKGLRALEEEKICKKYYLISCDPAPQKTGNIEALHWQDFLQRLWLDKIL